MDAYHEQEETIDIHADTATMELVKDVKEEKVDVQGDKALYQSITDKTKTVNVQFSSDDSLNLIDKRVETLSDNKSKSDTDCSSQKSSLQNISSKFHLENDEVKTHGQGTDNLKTKDNDKKKAEQFDQTNKRDKTMLKGHDPSSDVGGIDNNGKYSKPDTQSENKKYRPRNRKWADIKYDTCETVSESGIISVGKKFTVLDLLLILQHFFTNEPLNKMSETTKWIFNIEFEFILDITLYAVSYLPENTVLHIWDSAEILREILHDAIRRRVWLKTEQFRLATFCLYRGLSNVRTCNILKLAKKGLFCDLDGRIRCYHCNYICNIEHAETDTHSPNCRALENTSESIADNYGEEAPMLLTRGFRNRADDGDGHTWLRENGFTLQARLGQTRFIPIEGEIQESSPMQEASVSSERNGIQESELSAVANIPEPANTHQPTGCESTCTCRLIPSSCTHNRCHCIVDFASTNGASNSTNERSLAASLRESSNGPTFVPDADTREETLDAHEVRINSSGSDRGCFTPREAPTNRPVTTQIPNLLSSHAHLSCLHQRGVTNSQQANASNAGSIEQSRTGRLVTNTDFQTPPKAENKNASGETCEVLHNESQDACLTGVRTNTERTSWSSNIPIDNQFKDLAGNKHDNRVTGRASTKRQENSLQKCSTRDGSSEMSIQTTAKKTCITKINTQADFAETRDRKDTEKLGMSGVSNVQRSSLPEINDTQCKEVLESESVISGSDISATFQQNTTNKSSKAEQMPRPENGKETNVGILQTQQIRNQPCLVSSVSSPTLDGAPSTRQIIPNTNEVEALKEAACSISVPVPSVNRRKNRINRSTDSRCVDWNFIAAGSTQPPTMDFSTSYRNRERSFRGILCFNQSRKRMAMAGQYYVGPGDITRCYECGNLLKDWQRDDDPFFEHAMNYPECPLSQRHTRDLETLQETSQITQRDMSTSSENTSLDDSILVENEVMRQMLKCRLCESERSDRVGLPCGHMFMCHRCCLGLKLCLDCGAYITEFTTINNP